MNSRKRKKRSIDANDLFDFLTDQLEKETGAYSKGYNTGLNIARSALHDETITPTIAPEPNPPLTLEELREMDGDPVWVTCYDSWQLCYGLSDYRGYLCMETGHGSCILMKDYGKRWLAYRRKPEEGAP